MKTIEIMRRFSSMAEAVEVTGYDISYNPQDARGYISRLDSGWRGITLASVFVDQDNVLRYVVRTEDNVLVMHAFDPFVGGISDSPFEVYGPVRGGLNSCVTTAERLIYVSRMPKNNHTRELVSRLGLVVA